MAWCDSMYDAYTKYILDLDKARKVQYSLGSIAYDLQLELDMLSNSSIVCDSYDNKAEMISDLNNRARNCYETILRGPEVLQPYLQWCNNNRSKGRGN